MSLVEKKWKANQDKVAFLKNFPGLIENWEEGTGASLEQVIPLKSKPGFAVLIFSDGRFAITPSPTREPRDITEGVATARGILERKHPEAYKEFDHLAQADSEAGRMARLENILGAIENNMDQIPELKEHIRRLMKKWDTPDAQAD